MKFLFLSFLILFSTQSYAAKYATGLRMPEDWKKGAKFSRPLGVNLPTKFDWRDNTALPPIKNQGQCGSCWAFATTEVEEQLIAISDGAIVTLSTQELVSCDNTSYGCSGGYFTAFDYEKQKGLTYEKNFPYRASNTRCSTAGLPHDYRIFDWAYIGTENTAPSVQDIKAQIYAGGPVAVGVCADSRFMSYRGGIFTGKANCMNHMVVLVSYDDTTQTFGLQNSWGQGWGEKGFMRIRYGANGVGQVAAFAVYKPGAISAKTEMLSHR